MSVLTSVVRGGRLIRGLGNAAGYIHHQFCHPQRLNYAVRVLSQRPFSSFFRETHYSRLDFVSFVPILFLSGHRLWLGAVNLGHTAGGDSESGGSGGGTRPGGEGGFVGNLELVPEEPDPNDEETLRVEKVDLQIRQNAQDHHTDEYNITESADPTLVVRRGDPFNIKIAFNRPYDREKDDLRLVFQTGDTPKRASGTHVEFVLTDKDRPGAWGAKLVKQEGRTIEMKVFTPPQCSVAKWFFMVDVVKKKEDGVSLRRHSKQPFYILFNPWCKNDQVYMESEAEREEYVLKDSGRIYSGSSRKISSKPWVFGQFEDKILECSMLLLDKCRFRQPWDRGDPVNVTRQLSALVNVQDDQGVLVGNWSGDYAGGERPLSWTGSVAILQSYYDKKAPVKFGQCWVFSGVLTTVCRSLGIPTRSVTNFMSAHDVNASVSIDYYVKEDGSPVEYMNGDSVWNFHVWNEAWMARPELPHGYGGWQAFDATPQEMSGGVFCCGPCPVRAIKEGEVKLPYDGPFIFAEVNADRLRWQVNDDGSKQIISCEKKSVGKYISTYADSGRKDVTLEYKHYENSAAERVAVRRAQQLTSSPAIDYMDDKPKDMEFKLDFDAEGTFVGDEFILKLQCHNQSNEVRTLQGVASVRTMFYTGVEADEAASRRFLGIELKPGQREDVEVKVAEDDYFSKLKDMCMLSVSAMARVKETAQIFSRTDDARLRKPHLEITGPTSAQVGGEIEFQVSFTNPVSCKLTNCYLDLDAPGFEKQTRFKQSDLGGKETFSTSVKVKPTKVGKRKRVIVFNFNSHELEDINATYEIQVTQ